MSDIKAKELLVLQVEIGCSTTSWEFGRQLLSIFTDLDKRLNPQTIHIWSDKVSDFQNIDSAERYWATAGKSRSNGSLMEFYVGMGWKRHLTTKYQAEISHERQDSRGRRINATFSLYAVPHKNIDWRTFAHRIYQLTNARVGFLHIHRDLHKRADLSNAREPRFAHYDCTDYSIPNLAWSTFLGSGYFPFVDKTEISSTGMSVETLGNGLVITLSDNVMDVCNDFETFDLKRNLVKSKFPKGFIAPFSHHREQS